MRGITEERLRDILRHTPFLDVSELIDECTELNPWQQIDEFENEANEGWCWIIYKGRVTEAYRDREGFYRFHRLSPNCYLRECITLVMPFDRPSWQELPKDPL